MSVPWHKRPKFWEWVELAAAGGALASAIIAVWDKLAGAVWGSACGAVLLIAKFTQKRLEKQERIDRERMARQMIKTLLRGMIDDYFAQVPDENRYQHRATLFICQDADPARGLPKRLEIHVRVGVFEDSPCVLRVDENERSKCEGVAGQIWFLDAPHTEELPEWPANDDMTAKAAYAGKGFLSIERAAALHVKSRVLSGVMVRVFGRKWGVLIVDSQTLGFITKHPQKVKLIRWYADLIGQMLEEAMR
ncbi:MAG: hypothetical protein L0241_27060 [Planctomycetia bacterium]|nr:hypothetical protein [Planctomycetia bacterium]